MLKSTILCLIILISTLHSTSASNDNLKKYLAEKIFGTSQYVNHVKRNIYEADEFLNELDRIDQIEELYQSITRNPREVNQPYNTIKGFEGK